MSGTVTLSAEVRDAAGGVIDTLTISSGLVPILNVNVSPNAVTMRSGDKVTLTVTASDSAGNIVGTANGNPLGARATVWTSGDARTATVNAVNVLQAMRKGDTTVEARAGFAGPATVSVVVQ